MSRPIYTDVHSPHVLAIHERAALEQLKRDPSEYVGLNFVMSAMGFADVGTHFMFIVQVPFGKGIFPDLARPAILGPQGQQQVPKTFDHGLGLPPTLRMIVKPSVLDRPIRRAVEELLALEGQSLDDPAVRERFERANNPQRDGTPPSRRFNIPPPPDGAQSADPFGRSPLAAAANQAKVGEDAKATTVDDIEKSLNEALGDDGPTDDVGKS